MQARQLFLGAIAVASVFGVDRPADAHSGGLDGTGGHHCRQAGYDSGKCSPLNSYHCHQSPCGEAAPATTEAPPTTAAPRTTATKAAPTTTTTSAPTTTTTAPTTTTSTTTAPTTTTTAPTTTTSTTTLSDVEPAASQKESDDQGAAGFAGAVLLGGLGFAAYRVVKRRTRSSDGAA